MVSFFDRLIRKQQKKFSCSYWLRTIAVLFFVSNTFLLFGQTGKNILSVMSESDQKKYERAQMYKSDGDKLMDEANRLNAQIILMQKDYNLSEKQVQQEVSSLESEIYIKQFDAELDYQKFNEIRYNLLKKYSKKFLDHYGEQQDKYVSAKEMEEQADDLYYKSRTKIFELKKVRDKTKKIAMLKEANDLGNRATQKMVAVLEFYYGL